jgi:hypothetical protein
LHSERWRSATGLVVAAIGVAVAVLRPEPTLEEVEEPAEAGIPAAEPACEEAA